MNRMVLTAVLLLLLMVATPCYAATWHLSVSFEPGGSGSNEKWFIDTDSINKVRPDYIEAWVKSDYSPAVQLGEDDKPTQLTISIIGFSKDKRFCVVKATQYFTDRTLLSDSADCVLREVLPNSPAEYIWRYLYNAQ